MNKSTKPVVFIAIAVIAMLALACVSTTPAASPGVTPVRGEPVTQVPTPLPTATEVVKLSVAAPIDRVDLITSSGQATLNITSGLPSGCAEFESSEIVPETGGTIVATVTNLEPAPGQLIACTMIYGMHESVLDLEGEYEPCQTYSANINDQTFELQASDPLVDCAPPASFGEAPAPIDGVRFDAVDGSTGGADLVVTSGLPNACWEDAGYSDLLRKGDRISLKVSNVRTAPADAACAEIYRTVEHRIPLSDIQACETYDVVINDSIHTVQAIAPNVRCRPPEPGTLPTPTRPLTEIVPAPIDDVEVVMKGEDYIAIVTSGLPNGCDTFGGYEIERSDQEIRVEVFNETSIDPALACILVYTTVVTEVPLGNVFGQPQDYTLFVNGQEYPLNETPVEKPDTGDSASRVELELGQSVEIADGISVRFDSVSEDSRCPADVVCIWQGRAVAAITLLEGRDPVSSGSVELGAEGTTLGEYGFRLVELTPYPGTPEFPSRGAPNYVAAFEVSLPSADSSMNEWRLPIQEQLHAAAIAAS